MPGNTRTHVEFFVSVTLNSSGRSTGGANWALAPNSDSSPIFYILQAAIYYTPR